MLQHMQLERGITFHCQLPGLKLTMKLLQTVLSGLWKRRDVNWAFYNWDVWNVWTNAKRRLPEAEEKQTQHTNTCTERVSERWTVRFKVACLRWCRVSSPNNLQNMATYQTPFTTLCNRMDMKYLKDIMPFSRYVQASTKTRMTARTQHKCKVERWKQKEANDKQHDPTVKQVEWTQAKN